MAEEIIENLEKPKKSDAWKWLLGGAILTGILGAGYVGYEVYDSFKDILNGVKGMQDDGLLSFDEFRGLSRYVNPEKMVLNGNTKLDLTGDKTYEMYSTIENGKYNLNIDVNSDGRTDIHLAGDRTFDGKLANPVYEVNKEGFTIEQIDAVGFDKYTTFLENWAGSDLNNNGQIGS